MVKALSLNMKLFHTTQTDTMPKQSQRSPPSASASLAASKAFVKASESHSNLSNAAAAAALRTHVTTPTPVGDTVTKRMVRRGSTSSNGSGAISRPGLQRQSSTGSMTERTFRNSSPGRASPADAPPVPAVPKNLTQSENSHRRASSMEPIGRGGSPTPRGGGRGVSLDRGSGPSMGGRGQRVTSNLSQVVEVDQEPGPRSSVNFSRPMSPASAARQSASPQSTKGWFGGPVVNQDAVQRMLSTSRPKTSSSVPATDLRHAQQSVQSAADRPVKIHQVAQGAQGLRLSSGSMRAKPAGTSVESRSFLQHEPQQPRGPVDPKSPDAIFDPSTRTFIHKQDAMARHRELHQEPEEPVRQYVEQHLDDHRQHQISLPRTPSPARPVRHEEQHVAPVNESAKDNYPNDLPADSHHSRDGDFAGAEVRTVEHGDNTRTVEQTAQLHDVDPVASPKLALNQDSPYPRLPTPVNSAMNSTATGHGRGMVRTPNDRGQSLSPPRNAHFAPVAIELAGTKHQPPPRSISPAKSALKSSPSVSRRGSSPIEINGRALSRGTPSETSDTTSDGGNKKKRDIRVSFEEKPVIAGTSSYADPDTPISPSGLGASKWSPTREKDNEFEDFMKPRPALPSFGSIRDKERRGAQDDVPEKVTETVSSTPLTASVASITEPLNTSSDHALAGVVSHDFAQKQASRNDPLPPEVTSVEGSGYVSDSSDDVNNSPGERKHGAVDDSSQILPVLEPKSLSAPLDEKPVKQASIKEQIVEVPEIALLPATPSPYEKPEPVFQTMSLPGSWSEDVSEPRKEAKTSSEATTKSTQSAPAIQPIQPPTNLRELVEQNESSDDDDHSSIYSDAYEDLTDAEGGFGSIDAVFDNPAVPSSSGLMFSKYADKSLAEGPKSGLRNEVVAGQSKSASAQDWDGPKQHWSSINESRRQPMQDASHSNDVATTAQQSRAERRAEPTATVVQRPSSSKSQGQNQTAQPGPKPLKSALKKSEAPQYVPPAEPQMRKTMRGPAPRQDRATEPQMRTTMRGPSLRENHSSEPQMRKTMRGGVDAAPRAQPQMRSSMRGASPVTSDVPLGLAASRHSMVPAQQKPPRGALQKKHIPASAKAPRPQSMPVAQVKPSVPTYDSDSDASASSFQRSRARRNTGGRTTMRSSMRTGPAPTMRASAPAPAAVRSISPPDSPTPAALRKSMRPTSPTPDGPKSSRFSIRSLSPMGRFRSSKPIEAAPPSPTQPKKVSGFGKQTKPKATPERTKPVFKSRFADSSDEDDDDRPRFQSRFADSDDDEPIDYKLPPGLAPVRGIPRRPGEEDGDSTDLEEEVEDRPEPSTVTKEVTTNGVTNGKTNASGQGAILASGSLRDSKHAPALPSFEGGGRTKSKRSFFGLGKKKTQDIPPLTQEPTPSTEPSDLPMPPAPRNREIGLPLTPIDEDKDMFTPQSSPPSTKKSPKLQRRSTPEWPLPRNNIPAPPIPEDDARPMSSDGIAPKRPHFQKRQSSTFTNATAPVDGAPDRKVSYGKNGKKKKFQGLRRAFGLND